MHTEDVTIGRVTIIASVVHGSFAKRAGPIAADDPIDDIDERDGIGIAEGDGAGDDGGGIDERDGAGGGGIGIVEGDGDGDGGVIGDIEDIVCASARKDESATNDAIARSAKTCFIKEGSSFGVEIVEQ